MKSVFLVQHLHAIDYECENVKIIGIYRTREAALASIEKVKGQPGFEAFPELRNPLEDYEVEDDFYIGEYTLDENRWTDCYATV